MRRKRAPEEEEPEKKFKVEHSDTESMPEDNEPEDEVDEDLIVKAEEE